MHMTDLTPEQLERIQTQMRQRQSVLEQEIREVKTQLVENRYATIAGEVHDSGDEAAADAMIDVEHAMVARDLNELRDIEAARKRMAAGRYGECIDCGDAIDRERLLVYPTAKRCLPCQVMREHTYRRQATPRL
jgi:DnaK suppressor protein